MENEQLTQALETHEAIEPIEDTASKAPDEPDAESVIASLNEQIRTLTQKLTEKEQRESFMSMQLSEFCENFPDVDVRKIPDEVFDGMKEGNSLSSSYALYKVKADRIAEQNQKNAYRSTGRIGKTSSSEYFSADEVKKMSPSEVKANYTKIIESMKKWN